MGPVLSSLRRQFTSSPGRTRPAVELRCSGAVPFLQSELVQGRFPHEPGRAEPSAGLQRLSGAMLEPCWSTEHGVWRCSRSHAAGPHRSPHPAQKAQRKENKCQVREPRLAATGGSASSAPNLMAQPHGPSPATEHRSVQGEPTKLLSCSRMPTDQIYRSKIYICHCTETSAISRKTLEHFDENSMEYCRKYLSLAVYCTLCDSFALNGSSEVKHEDNGVLLIHSHGVERDIYEYLPFYLRL